MKALFKKDFSLFFGDRKNILLTFLLPLVLVSIFTLAFSGLRSDQKAASVQSVKIGIIDDDKSFASKTIISELNNQSILAVSNTDSARAFKALRKGKLMGVLHINKGFMESYNAKDQDLKWRFNYLKGSEFQVNILKSFFLPMMEKMGRKYDPSAQQCKSNMTLAFEPVKGNQAVVEAYNDPWLIQPIIGIAIILLLFNTINVGGHFIDEYNNKTLSRLLISPVNYYTFIGSKFLIGFLVCLIQFSVILAFASFFLGLKLFNLSAIAVLVVACSFACTAFYLLMTAISKTRNQLNSLSIAGILFLSAIGGSMMPSFIMPTFLQKIGQFSINYWAIESFFDVLWRRAAFYPVVSSNVVVLLLIGVGLLSVSLVLFKRKFAHL